jgi:hypothetical protein
LIAKTKAKTIPIHPRWEDITFVFLEKSGSKIRMRSANARIMISGDNRLKFMSGRIKSII